MVYLERSGRCGVLTNRMVVSINIMKKKFPLALVLIGAVLLISAVVTGFVSGKPEEPKSLNLGLSTSDWITIVIGFAGIGASIKGWIDLFKKDKPSIKTGYTANKSQSSLEMRLPDKKYLRLVGRESEIKECLDSLRNPNEKRFVGLIGMGGVGKSALAREIIERIRDENFFSSFVWLTAKQQALDLDEEISSELQVSYETLLNRLISWLGLTSKLREEKKLANREAEVKKALAQTPVLVMLDNLETSLDQEEIVQRFVNLLKTTSCRVILTSREEWKQTKHSIKQIALKGLKENDAISLMREVAQGTKNRRGLTASESSLRKIARAVGYMPLALKITVGLLDNFDLQILLSDLEKLSSEQVKSMYDYLFANTWRALGDSQRRVLIAISTFDEDEGVSAKHLQRTKVVPENEFANTVERLTQVSMIEVVGSVEKTRYTLHPLTLNFIRLQIAQ